MFTRLNRQEANERNLHGGQYSEGIPSIVCDIEARAEPACYEDKQGMQRNETGDKSITTPGGNHVAVSESAKGAPENRAQFQSLDPEIEGYDEKENGNGLIIVGTGDRARDITRGDPHKGGGEKAGRRGGSHLIGQEIGSICRQTRECRGQQDTDVSNINRDSEESEDVVDDTAGDHETWV